MVSIVTKRIKGKEYLYLVDSVRDKERVIQKTIKYIGPKRPVREEEFECMKFSYEDKDWVLNEFNGQLSYQDHAKMKEASGLYKKYVQGLDEVSREKERERFLSAFISNSNAIEGSTLTIKDTFNYLFNDIVPEGYSKKELFMATNLLEAWEYLEKNFKRKLIERNLFEMHKLVNRNIESEETLGKYKRVQNYVGNAHTTAYVFVEEKMLKWFNWIGKAFREIDDFEVAFQSHAQFEIIHPFVDGNGRVGRLALNWLLMNKGLAPLAIPVNKRKEYISALDNARIGNVEYICKFCFKEYITQYKFL